MSCKRHNWKYYDKEIVPNKRAKGWTRCRVCSAWAPKRKMSKFSGVFGAKLRGFFLPSLLTEEYPTFLTLAMTIFYSGCASFNPHYLPKDEFLSPVLEMQKSFDAKLEEVYKAHPEWKNTLPDDSFYMEFTDANGKIIGSGKAVK